MEYSIIREIEKFDQKCLSLGGDIQVNKLADFVYLVSPELKSYQPKLGKEIDLTLMAITHGNEFVGVRVLNDVLDFISNESFQLKISVCFVLGNPWAARENKRFLEADLNRSFARDSLTAKEHHRARELEGVLSSTSYLVDLHQTREKSESPFFIFPYSKGSFTFAREISSEIPIVTHWGKPFSKTGQCTDEFVNGQSGTGLTIELGQNGFDAYKIEVGFKAILRVLEVVEGKLYKNEVIELDDDHDVFTWLDIVEFPESGSASLKPGYFNFVEIVDGENFGEKDGEPLIASENCKILFPYYPNKTEKKSAELCRLLKKIKLSELPVDSLEN